MRKLIQLGIVLAAMHAIAAGQQGTRVDMKVQGRNPDFGESALARPFRTGTVLPASCAIGEMFFKTNAPDGANSYGCVLPNVWAVQGNLDATLGVGLQVVYADSTHLTIGAECTPTKPCLYRLGSTVYTRTAAATVTLISGGGTVYIYINSAGQLSVGHSSGSSPSLSCSGCVTVSPVTNFPSDAIALATWQASSGTWSVAGYDQRAVMARERRLVAGANISLTEASDTVTVAAAVTSFDPLDMSHDIVIDKPGSDQSATTPAGYATVAIGTGPCTGVGEAAGGSDVVGHRVQTGEVAGDGCYLVARGENDSPYYGDISGAATFQPFQFRGRLRLVDTVEQKAFLGLFSETTSSASVTDGVYLEYDPAIDSNWQCTVRTGGSATRVDTGVAASTDYVTVEVRATVPGSLSCSVGTTSATVVATFPSAVHFGWYNETTGIVAQGLVVSDVRRKVTGLNR